MYKPGDSNFSDIASRQIALLFENVSKNYEITTGQRLLSLKHNPEVVTALREINLIIHEGDSVGLVGRNGSGKSTLLRLASGAENPTDGNIFGIE
ncbi:MAG: ATP-binding cassette domain-containing protein, partial [Mixta calida]|nr:ATP-binding cassette domain-containing protein [Mixta calida]